MDPMRILSAATDPTEIPNDQRQRWRAYQWSQTLGVSAIPVDLFVLHIVGAEIRGQRYSRSCARIVGTWFIESVLSRMFFR